MVTTTLRVDNSTESRLIYADWLEDEDVVHGAPRAAKDPDRVAFIRAQCELAPLCSSRDPIPVLAGEFRLSYIRLNKMVRLDWKPTVGERLDFRIVKRNGDIIRQERHWRVAASDIDDDGRYNVELEPDRMSGERVRLEKITTKLLKKHGWRWCGPLEEALDLVGCHHHFRHEFRGATRVAGSTWWRGMVSWRFRRGFIEEIAMPVLTWAVHHERLKQFPIRKLVLCASELSPPTKGEMACLLKTMDDSFDVFTIYSRNTWNFPIDLRNSIVWDEMPNPW